jgi:hypothetical protein
MPLALTGFALTSVPLKGSTALSSSLVTFSTACDDSICQCRRADKWFCWELLIRRLAQPNSHTMEEVLIHLRVRSRPRWSYPPGAADTLWAFCAF